MPEEEVSKRVLPDHLTNNLDIIIVSLSVNNYSVLVLASSKYDPSSFASYIPTVLYHISILRHLLCVYV